MKAERMNRLTWVLESDVFPKSHPQLRTAVRKAGHDLVDWDDRWWIEGFPIGIGETPTIFHGSLGNAARITAERNWSPGSFCDPEAFRCSSWYANAQPWLIHTEWCIVPAKVFVAAAREIARELGDDNRVFVRPDSPIKPFSGRIVDTASVTLATLDHGFYYEDESLPIVIAPLRSIGREWRFLIVRNQLVTGSEYQAETRAAIPDSSFHEVLSFGQSIADALPSPADVYMLDICECDNQLHLMELNPFGGADLYGCDSGVVVEAVSAVAESP